MKYSLHAFMKNRTNLLKDYITFHQNPRSKLGDKGNKVLYNMCKTYPYHKSADEIIAKIWLIGRSYAAAIERRKNKKDSSDNFYIRSANKIRNSNFDKKIQSIPHTNKLNEDCFKLIYNAHSYITKKFYKITGLNKRSLASKYLHFHRPIVPIYDSRARQSIAEMFDRYEFLKYPPDKIFFTTKKLLNHDKEYLKFIKKIFRFQKFLLESNCKYYTMRDIDKYLVELQERKFRAKKRSRRFKD